MTLPSFLIIEKCIKEFIPLSLKEKNTQKMRVLYKMLNQIFSDTDVYKLLSKIEQPGLLAANLIKIIQEREINESSSRDEDVVLGGLFDFLG
jgi:predicted methyltransferase